MQKLMIILTAVLYITFTSCTQGNSTGMAKPVSSNVTAIMSMHEPRASHTATLLKDGKVLIAGGFKKGTDGHSQLYTNSAELFDPAKNTFTEIESMHEQRCDHTATILPNGNVLVTGGTTGENLSSAELFNTTTGHWEILPSLMAPRSGHQAVLLPNNKVLLIGGSPGIKTFAEIFNIKTGRFGETLSAPFNVEGPVTTMLQNGNILIAGGNMNHEPVQYALIYDYKTNTFTQTKNMKMVRHKSGAALLPDGNVLVIAGSNNRDWKGKYKSTEVFNVKENTFQKGPDLNYERFKFINAVTITGKGTIVITGGDKHIEILKGGSSVFETAGELDHPLYYSYATALNSGDVLITGGYGNDVQSTDKAWIFHLK